MAASPNETGTARVTLRDVARAAEVHPGTASRALNVETRSLVNEETARRVLDAAERLGYRPNPIARGLKTNRSYTIGVLIPDITNPLFPPILRGIEEQLAEFGYTPLIANTDNDPERERADWLAMRARQVDGIIAATARREDTLLPEIVESGLRLVLVNRRVEDPTIPAATPNDRSGMRQAVEHLAGLGHRRIAHVAGPLEFSSGYDRHEAFVDTMRTLGLDPDPARVVQSGAFTEPAGAQACRELLERDGGVTAIAAGNDLIALGCYDVLTERGAACPDDVSIVGFNDMPFCDRFQPPLSTVRIGHHELGRRAAELMLEALQQPRADARQIQVEPELVVRASSGPPPASDGRPAA
jgi:LacI family transcriptional regulator